MRSALLACIGVLLTSSALAQSVIVYGDQDVLDRTVTYPGDPTAGAALVGLAPGEVAMGSLRTRHFGFPTPSPGEFPGTDQIYVGTGETRMGFDAYSRHPSRMEGPQVVALDYSSLVPAGFLVETLTLGIAPDDMQSASTGSVYSATINGVVDVALSDHLNTIDLTGPNVVFFTIGMHPSGLDPAHVLTLEIDQSRLGFDPDAWAVDFFTVGVTTAPIPTDSDGDGIFDARDNCPGQFNPDQEDVDGDQVGDACDNCAPLANADQTDADANGFGDRCDSLREFVGGVVEELLDVRAEDDDRDKRRDSEKRRRHRHGDDDDD